MQNITFDLLSWIIKKLYCQYEWWNKDFVPPGNIYFLAVSDMIWLRTENIEMWMFIWNHEFALVRKHSGVCLLAAYSFCFNRTSLRPIALIALVYFTVVASVPRRCAKALDLCSCQSRSKKGIRFIACESTLKSHEDSTCKYFRTFRWLLKMLSIIIMRLEYPLIDLVHSIKFEVYIRFMIKKKNSFKMGVPFNDL